MALLTASDNADFVFGLGYRYSGAVAFALLDGDNPIKIWRTYRGLTQAELAQRAGISVPYLSQIENQKRTGQQRFCWRLPKN